ncbi:MAG TPA: AsmA-like C-terminal region-containing protein, partial [Terriglobales bacterium]
AEVLNIAHSFGAASDLSGSGRFALNVTANGPVKNTAAMTFSGNGSLKNATIRTAQLTQPVNIQNAAMTFSQNGVALDNFAGSIASTHANGKLSVKNFDAPQIQLALNADKIDALEWQKLVAPSPQQKTNSPSLLSKATGGGPVTIGSIVYDQLVLNDVKSTVTLDHGIIKLSPVSAQVAGGLSTGAITIDTRPAQTQFMIAMNVQKVDANKLISSVSNVKNTLYGLLASNMQTQFHSVPEGKDIASTLNGHLALNLADGKIAGVDFLQQLGSVAKFQSLGRAASGATELKKLTGDFDVQNGVAKTTNLKADLGTGTMAAQGILSLVDNSINMKVTTVLNKAYSQQVGGSSIGGFMQTALANNQGELVLPVLVTGTLQSPKIAPDTEAIAQMKLQNLVPSLANPGALTSIFGKGGNQQGQQNPLGGILGALQGKKSNTAQEPNQPQQNNQQQAQPQQQQPNVNDAINALGGLFGKKKKPTQQQQQQQQQQPPPQ